MTYKGITTKHRDVTLKIILALMIHMFFVEKKKKCLAFKPWRKIHTHTISEYQRLRENSAHPN